MLVGSFNPKIFQPSWLGAQGLLSKAEADNADVSLIHPQVSVFRTDRLNIQVQPMQFVASCTDPKDQEPLLDVVIGCFRILQHTPISLMGINLNFHFALGSRVECDRLGFALVPREPWARAGLESAMKDLAVQAPRGDENPGFLQIRVQPSVRYAFGVFIQVNDHYDLTQIAGPGDAAPAMDLLERVFSDSIRRSRTIAQALVRG